MSWVWCADEEQLLYLPRVSTLTVKLDLNINYHSRLCVIGTTRVTGQGWLCIEIFYSILVLI